MNWPLTAACLILALMLSVAETEQGRAPAWTLVQAPSEQQKLPLPLEVDFSTPIQDEADVRLDVTVRIQFSRDVDAASLTDRVRMSYSASESAERGEAQPPALHFATKYVADSRSLEIKPSQALERFRHVKVELLEGIVGTDGSVLRPWSLNFTTGGS
jgi:hypothetical protein